MKKQTTSSKHNTSKRSATPPPNTKVFTTQIIDAPPTSSVPSTSSAVHTPSFFTEQLKSSSSAVSSAPTTSYKTREERLLKLFMGERRARSMLMAEAYQFLETLLFQYVQERDEMRLAEEAEREKNKEARKQQTGSVGTHHSLEKTTERPRTKAPKKRSNFVERLFKAKAQAVAASTKICRKGGKEENGSVAILAAPAAAELHPSISTPAPLNEDPSTIQLRGSSKSPPRTSSRAADMNPTVLSPTQQQPRPSSSPQRVERAARHNRIVSKRQQVRKAVVRERFAPEQVRCDLDRLTFASTSMELPWRPLGRELGINRVMSTSLTHLHDVSNSGHLFSTRFANDEGTSQDSLKRALSTTSITTLLVEDDGVSNGHGKRRASTSMAHHTTGTLSYGPSLSRQLEQVRLHHTVTTTTIINSSTLPSRDQTEMREDDPTRTTMLEGVSPIPQDGHNVVEDSSSTGDDDNEDLASFDLGDEEEDFPHQQDLKGGDAVYVSPSTSATPAADVLTASASPLFAASRDRLNTVTGTVTTTTQSSSNAVSIPQPSSLTLDTHPDRRSDTFLSGDGGGGSAGSTHLTSAHIKIGDSPRRENHTLGTLPAQPMKNKSPVSSDDPMQPAVSLVLPAATAVASPIGVKHPFLLDDDDAAHDTFLVEPEEFEWETLLQKSVQSTAVSLIPDNGSNNAATNNTLREHNTSLLGAVSRACLVQAATRGSAPRRKERTQNLRKRVPKSVK